VWCLCAFFRAPLRRDIHVFFRVISAESKTFRAVTPLDAEINTGSSTTKVALFLSADLASGSVQLVTRWQCRYKVMTFTSMLNAFSTADKTLQISVALHEAHGRHLVLRRRTPTRLWLRHGGSQPDRFKQGGPGVIPSNWSVMQTTKPSLNTLTDQHARILAGGSAGVAHLG
jgi:hypothetical protein